MNVENPDRGKCAQFLFAMFQGSGNIPPILAVARGLVARGHNVRILAGPGLQPDRPPRPISASFLEGVHAAGAGLILLQQARDPFASLPPVRGIIKGWTPRVFAAHVFLARRYMAAPVWAENVTAELDRNPADAVVADVYLPGALVAAEASGVPSAALVHHHDIRPTTGVPPFGPGWLPASGPSGRMRDAMGRAVVNRIYRRDGLQPVNRARIQVGLPALQSPLQQYDRAARVLIMTSQAFDFPIRSLRPNTRYVGMPFEDAGAETWISPWSADDKRPLVLVSFSTAPQGQEVPLQRTLDALAMLPVRALVTLGPSLRPEQFHAPANAALVPFVPHALVLPQTAVVVSQCGHGTVMKTLAHGVPLVCIPLIADQHDIAARVVYAGAGVRLPRTASAERIRIAIQQVLSESRFRIGAQRLALAMAKEDGVGTAVVELESLAAPAVIQ